MKYRFLNVLWQSTDFMPFSSALNMDGTRQCFTHAFSSALSMSMDCPYIYCSQGGATSLMLLRSSIKLGGIIGAHWLYGQYFRARSCMFSN